MPRQMVGFSVGRQTQAKGGGKGTGERRAQPASPKARDRAPAKQRDRVSCGECVETFVPKADQFCCSKCGCHIDWTIWATVPHKRSKRLAKPPTTGAQGGSAGANTQPGGDANAGQREARLNPSIASVLSMLGSDPSFSHLLQAVTQKLEVEQLLPESKPPELTFQRSSAKSKTLIDKRAKAEKNRSSVRTRLEKAREEANRLEKFRDEAQATLTSAAE